LEGEVESAIVGNNWYRWCEEDPMLPALAVCLQLLDGSAIKHIITNLYLFLSAGNLISVAVSLCEAGKGGSTAHTAQLVFFFFSISKMLQCYP